MNSVALVGRLTKDPELRQIGDKNRSVCDLRIAVDNGKHGPTYVDVSTFDGSAEACAEHLSKGRQVAVSGRLVYREWKADDGSPRSKHSVIGRVEFLGSKNGAADSGESSDGDASDEDIPF
jgi:single-strand DNA-binding protein